MDFALMVEPHLGGTYDDLVALARWAEDNGLVSFTRSDHFYADREPRADATDAFATLAGLARDTSRIRLCVLVSPVTFRHPAVIAKMAATIDQMSGGRLDLGVGTGWMDFEHEAYGLPFPPWKERFERLEETLEYLKVAFGDGAGSFDGSYYSINADARPKPTGPMPIIIGGSGSTKTPTLAGTFADEYNHFTTTPEVLAPKTALVREVARAAGRDPDAITLSLTSNVVTGPDQATYEERLAAMAAERSMDTEAFRARLDEIGVPHGPAGVIGERFRALEEMGASKFYLQFFDEPTVAEVDEVLQCVTA